MKKHLPKAALVVLKGLLFTAVIMAMTSCPSAAGPEEEGFAKLLASDGAASNYFGHSVSIDGDYAIVGATGGNSGKGAAYVFVRDGTGWSQQAILTASDGNIGDYFGVSVSISWDYAIVGAQYNDIPTKENAGKAYIFVRSGTTWTEQAKLTASDSATGDQFGYSVSISGNDAIIGAFAKSNNTGAAYVFVRSGANWSEQEKLTASDSADWDFFGISVSISGDYAIAGAYGDDDQGSYSGSAYVFARSGTDWSQQEKLTASDGEAGDSFGLSVSIQGDSALVGAYADDSNRGAAYVFVRSGTDWSEQEKFTADDRASGDEFGRCVSINGDNAIAGAAGDDDQGDASGSAYLFVRSGTDWAQQGKLVADDGAAADNFGCSVAISENCAVAGARMDDDQGDASGSAYIFD